MSRPGRNARKSALFRDDGLDEQPSAITLRLSLVRECSSDLGIRSILFMTVRHGIYHKQRYAGDMKEFSDATSELGKIPSGIALTWGIDTQSKRGPKRELSIERIVGAAVELADEQGLAAVSMAAVARKLDFTAMSLYRYVSTKDNLLLLMQEEAVGLPPLGEREDGLTDWRPRIEELYRAQVENYVRHPWVTELVQWTLGHPSQGAPATPHNSAWLEAGLAAFDHTSLNYEERTAMTLAVTGQARWHGTVLAGYAASSRKSGLSVEEINSRENALFDAVIREDEFPHVRAAIDSGLFLSDADPFQFGASRLLDGIEAYILRAGSK